MEVVSRGAVPRFIEFLTRDDNHQLQVWEQSWHCMHQSYNFIYCSLNQWQVCYTHRVLFFWLQAEAARALRIIASGTSERTKLVAQSGTVPIFVKLLNSQSEAVCEQAWT